MHRRFHLSMRKNFFAVEVTAQEQVSQRNLEKFNNCLNTNLCRAG